MPINFCGPVLSIIGGILERHRVQMVARYSGEAELYELLSLTSAPRLGRTMLPSHALLRENAGSRFTVIDI